jgi:hypothetical protein
VRAAQQSEEIGLRVKGSEAWIDVQPKQERISLRARAVERFEGGPTTPESEMDEGHKVRRDVLALGEDREFGECLLGAAG